MKIDKIPIEEAYNLILHPIQHIISINPRIITRMELILLHAVNPVLADKVFQEGNLSDEVRESLTPTPEQYKARLVEQYRICETKSHKKGWKKFKKGLK
ncbi:MAG: hypothetical protein WA102_06845 [Candidatus Methanoperedens sp.]